MKVQEEEKLIKKKVRETGSKRERNLEQWRESIMRCDRVAFHSGSKRKQQNTPNKLE